ncbi:MAG TPA: hypothetical protein VLH86_04065, partial [Patescibacteria group bacterium]|nr:hypothetical protein [Patescibacteria group bacterium]
QPDQNAKLSFTITPIGGGVQQGRQTNGRVQYPSAGGQRFYTFRKNGVAEDILLTKAPADTAQYQWKLNLPSSLEARMLPSGAVGIYSANPDLFGNIQVGDSKSQTLLDKARKNGAKDTLAFALPAPVIKTTTGKTDYGHTKFSLKDNILTLTATELKKLSYPLSIDPSVVVTTTNDFRTGYDDGMIDYTTTADQITRANISGGAVGSVANTYSFTAGRSSTHTSVVYDGYLYIIGGLASPSATGCTTAYSSAFLCNDIQYAQIKSDGSLCLPGTSFGTCTGNVFTQQTSAFTTARAGHTSVVYNGYLYIAGGYTGSSVTGCTTSLGGGAFLCNDIQYCPLNSSTGAVGDGISGNNECTQQLNAFTTARDAHSSVVYNGYLYIIGGGAVASATGCDANGRCNDIQYCPLNATGSVGSCTQQLNAFTTARSGHASVVANGYLYIMGGIIGTISATSCTTPDSTSYDCNDIQYCPLNANGTVGVCTQQVSAFNTARSYPAAVVYNGFLYISGGGYMNDVQELQIQPMGTAGPTTQQTSAFTTARASHSSVVYNGYIYIIGGCSAYSAGCSGLQSDVQRCPINTDGSTGACTTQAAAFTTAREAHASVAANGYV